MQTAIRTIILALVFGAARAHAGDLAIRIDNVDSNDGQVMVALYDGAANFMKRPVQQVAVAAIAGATRALFKDLAPGEYGLAIFHDANGNGRMDTNAMGIPIERFGFSNDAQGSMGPPAFGAVKFSVPAAGAAVTVNLR